MSSSTSGSGWRESYLAALEVRDAREKANVDIYEAYTKLADHAASLAANQQPPTPAPPRETEPITTPTTSKKIPPPILNPKARSTASPPPSNPTTTTTSAPTPELHLLRTDLAAAQKSKTALTTTLTTLQSAHETLAAAHAAATAAQASLAREKAGLERRLRDRDSELREKRALLEAVQDEVIGLEMQVNVAEEAGRKLRAENEALVRRLVGEREEVVERVNRESGW